MTVTNSRMTLTITPAQANRFYRYVLAALAVIVLACYLTVFYRLQVYGQAIQLLGAGQSAVAFTLPRLNGQGSVTLADLRGQPALLTFADLTCEVSLAQLPALETFAAKHSEIATVVIVRQSRVAVVEKMPLAAYPHLRLLTDGEATYSDYGVYRTPTNFVIDAAGLIRYVQVGGLSQVRHFEAYLLFLNVVNR